MLTEDFMRRVFEIAFGSQPVKGWFTREDVLQRLRELSDAARKAEEPAKSYDDCSVSIYSVTYCMYDKEGNEICNDDGSTKLFKDYEGQVDTTTWAEWVEPEMLSEVDSE